MDTDDGVRGKNGIVLSLREVDNDTLRVVMDDVSNESSSTKTSWNHEIVVTWKDYKEKELLENNLSEKELADLGANVVARLVALKNHPHK